MPSRWAARYTARLTVLSGLIGLVAVGCLIAALFAPTPSAHSMRRETNFFRWQDAGVILQALLMVPVTLGLYRLSTEARGLGNRLLAGLGVIAQIMLVICSSLIFTGTAADMLYMAPLGLVGIWLLAVSGGPSVSRSVVWTGRIAGFGLLLIGIGFLIYGAFVAPAIFLRPLTNAEIDAQSLTTPNLVAHICMALGTLLGRLGYPIWALLMGRALLHSRDRAATVTDPLPTWLRVRFPPIADIQNASLGGLAF